MPSNLPSKFPLIFRDAFDFFVQNLRQIAAVCVPFLLAASLFQVILMKFYPSGDFILFASMGANLVVYPIYTAALIHLMERRARNERPTTGALIAMALPQWGSLLTLKVLTTLLIIFGFSMFVVPGIWIWVRMVFAEYYLVLYRMHPLKAMEKSAAATRGHFMAVLLLLLVTYIPLLTTVLGFEFLLSAIDNTLVGIVVITAWSLIAQFVSVVLFRTFMEVVKEQSGTMSDMSV